jgi:predicted nucleotidyltransferase
LTGIVSEAREHLVAVYLAGSWQRGDALPDSDIDFVLVLRDEAPEEVASRLSRLRRPLSAKTGVDISLLLKPLSAVLKWAPGIKYDSLHLYGQDIRGLIPEPSIEEYVARLTEIAEHFSRSLRRGQDVHLTDLHYPRPDDEFFGYTHDPGTPKPLASLFSLTFIATAKIAKHGKRMVFSKVAIPRLYAEHVGDEFTPWIEELFHWGRILWHYTIPIEGDQRARLRGLCARAIHWERDFWMSR